MTQKVKSRAAFVVLVGWVVLAFVGPFLMNHFWGYSYDGQQLELGARPPSALHWFGTDFFGRDILIRVLYGLQISLAVGVLGALVSATIGAFYGSVSAFSGGRIDHWMMRFVDTLDCLPYMFLVLILVTFFERQVFLLFVALGCVGWLTMARIVRGQVLSLKERDFVLAARSVGVPRSQILTRYLLRNSLGPIFTYFTLMIPAMILQESFLSFLGLGVQAPRPSLGSMLNEGAQHMAVYWWELVFPGIAMISLLLAFHAAGESIRVAFSPKESNR